MIKGLYSCFNKWGKDGTMWLYSDPHFGDNLPNYPNDEEQIKSINSKVGKKDTLIILGDVGDVSKVKELKGYKILIKGNHDKGSRNYKRLKALCSTRLDIDAAIEKRSKEYPGWKIKAIKNVNGYILIADNCLFDEVYEGPVVISKKLILSHEPLDINWAFNIHGHDHQNHVLSVNHFNCCANVINFTPVSLDKLIKSGILTNIKSIHRQVIERRI